MLFTFRLFQSTLPARGATIYTTGINSAALYFNPHSPRGERHLLENGIVKKAGISIHTPREGSDDSHSFMPSARLLFQSTLPARGATDSLDKCDKSYVISIHTPREGSDTRLQSGSPRRNHFNPHSPRGERLQPFQFDIMKDYFNPHSPRGERP